MPLTDLVLAMLVSLPGPTPPQAPEISVAIARACGDDKLLAAELVELGRAESGFLPRIQAGECLKFECDHGKARTWFQFHKTNWSRAAWENVIGLEQEPITNATEVAATVLRAGRRACHSIAGTFSFYAKGHCGWRAADKRAVRVNRLMAIIPNSETIASNRSDL